MVSLVVRPMVKGLPPQLRDSVGFLLLNILWTFAAGEVSGNVSQVDRVWTFLPVIYSAYFTFYPLLDSAPLGLKAQGVQPRAVLMTALQVIWSARLSYNTFRRGLFSVKEEDYRWAVFREKVPRWFLSIFNFFFIAGFQNILLFLLGIDLDQAPNREQYDDIVAQLPAYSVSVTPVALHCGDFIIASLTLLAILGEFTADNQQWAFHNYKRTKQLDHVKEWPGARLSFVPSDAERGFLTKGLWEWSRHPNVAFEQIIWLLLSLFPFLTRPSATLRPTAKQNIVDTLSHLLPWLILSSLLFASTLFTESISTRKYPAYSRYYQRRVAMFWPILTLRNMVWLKLRGKKGETDAVLWGSEFIPIVSKDE